MKLLHAVFALFAALLFVPAAHASRWLACAALGDPPLELLFRPFLMGALRTRATSASNQWAGRTTLASGSATVVISTTRVASDSIVLYAALGNANVASGTNRVTEVKTISDGGYFTIGTQDGQAIPRDTTIIWEMRPTK